MINKTTQMIANPPTSKAKKIYKKKYLLYDFHPDFLENIKKIA